jgi:hypothetical protein
VLVVGATEAAEVFERVLAAEGSGLDVVDLDLVAAVAEAAGYGILVLAAALVAAEYLSSDATRHP